MAPKVPGFANPYKAASLGYIDEIIRPPETRWAVIRSLRTLANIPL